MIKFKLPQEFLNNIFLNQDAIDINNDLKKLGTEGTIKKYGTAEHNIRNNKQYLQINGTPDLNRLIREKRQSSDFETTKTLCDESHEKIQTIIHKHTNEELFEKKRYHRTGSTSLGSYLISATSSHYDRAYKFIKKQKNST